jgi:DNA-nicking Smr family endonuclease
MKELTGEPVTIPIDGTLDLHAFHPQDVKQLIPDYLKECQKRDIFHVRIIHGKGTGSLRRTVHANLRKNSRVVSWRQGNENSGSWGATLVELKKIKQPE